MFARALRPAGVLVLSMILMACPGDDVGGGALADGSTGPSGGDSASPSGPPSGGLDTTDDEGTSETGEPAGAPLIPCDPAAATPCERGVCAGHPMSGFYCRPACSGEAEPGTPCGADDVCLPVGAGADGTACFDVAECDALDGGGCPPGASRACAVVSLEPFHTACVPVGGAGAGEACTPSGMLDCGPGAACLGGELDPSADGLCVGWCEPTQPRPDGCPSCVALGGSIGICAECGVLDDACPPGSQCQLSNELLGGTCVGVGPGGPGAPCSPSSAAGSCQEGLLCIDLDAEGEAPPVCVEPCSPVDPQCSGEGQSCLDVEVFEPGAPAGQLGVCLAVGVVLCDPAAEPSSCAAGDNCLDVGGGLGVCGAPCDPTTGVEACDDNFACVPSDGSAISVRPFIEGNGACGAGCSTDADCGGQTCLHLDGLAAPGLCGTTCTPGMPGTCPGGESCVATPEAPTVGACMVGGTPCNPTGVGDCSGAACVPLEGETLIGICQPACFRQDPLACGGVPGRCQAKTDPLWHEGTCLGGGEPCSLVDDDCGPGRACGLTGGGAFGGHALRCDDEGPLGAEDACVGDESACGAGVGCIDGVCRAWCDPEAPACAAGACVDVSATVYLPPGTLGACL